MHCTQGPAVRVDRRAAASPSACATRGSATAVAPTKTASRLRMRMEPVDTVAGEIDVQVVLVGRVPEGREHVGEDVLVEAAMRDGAKEGAPGSRRIALAREEV